MNTFIRSFAAIFMLAAAAASSLAQDTDRWTGESRDAWVAGKIEAYFMVNPELENFDIVADVRDGRVILSGEVSSDPQKMLAGDIVRNVEGVTSVENRLEVNRRLATATRAGEEEGERSFATILQDLTTTARLKTRFAFDRELDASDIEIDTVDGEVRLYGDVDSQTKKDLAERMAREYEHVTSVRNDLRVVPSRSVSAREN